ncbi:MAG: hypothetical protein HQ541_17740 [Mariniphaga sp.]|nr:hypothetical protein [Mariniphaga sp.]
MNKTERPLIVSFQLYVNDLDYIAVRKLILDGFFSTAGSLANLVLDRYIKTFLWSIDREDVVKMIKGLGGNDSHDVLQMIEKCKEEGLSVPDLNSEEEKQLKNIHQCYCFRYIDYMFKTKSNAEMRDNYIHTVDKVAHFYRTRVFENPPQKGKAPIDLICAGHPIIGTAITCNRSDCSEILFLGNKYFCVV